MLERIACAVHARTFAVPQAENTIYRAFWVGLHPLRAQHLCGTQLFVDRGYELDARILKFLVLFPDHLVHHAQRRATVAADEAPGIPLLALIELALHPHQAHQGLRARQKHHTVCGPDVVQELVVA